MDLGRSVLLYCRYNMADTCENMLILVIFTIYISNLNMNFKN